MRKRIALAALTLVIVVVALGLHRLRPLGELGAGYAAEQTCSCVFVSARPLPSCRGDLDPLAQKLVSLRVGEAEVRASVVGLFRARAVFDARYGCTLVE